MAHPQVKQLQQLNLIIYEKVRKYRPKSIAVFGAGTGNGFEHFNDCESIYAIDINPEYLQICQARYNRYKTLLKSILADVGRDKLPIAKSSVDLVICHLILEYTDVTKTMRAINKILKKGGIVSVVIQDNGTSSFVSPTAISSLSPLSNFAAQVAEESIMSSNSLVILGYEEYNLINGKVFKSYDLIKS